jgi:Flp pilus assembly protein TadD
MLPRAKMLATENSLRKITMIFAVAVLTILSGCAPAGLRALISGDDLLRDGKPAQAVEKLKRAVDLLPNEPRAWNLLGLAYHRAGQPQMAAQAYRQALAKDRSNLVAVAHYNLGCLLLEQGSFSTAADELRSFTLITNNSAGFVKLATAQVRLRQFDAAERNFNSALKLDSRNAEAINGVGVIHAYRNQRDAAQYFNAALQVNPKYPPALLNAAVLAQQSPVTKLAALYRFRDYLALTPQPPQADLVKLIVRQLETDLAPQFSPSTNAIPVLKTNALLAALQSTSALRTNAGLPRVIAATNARPGGTLTKTNEVATTPKTNPPAIPPLKTNQLIAITNAPVPPADLPVTIVAVPGEPEPKIAPAQPVTFENTTDSSPVAPDVSDDAAIALDLSPAAAPGNEEVKKPGLFARLNPFRDRPKQPPPVTNEVPRTIVLVPRTNTSVASPNPVFPRYTYLSPAAPSGGNRVNAERAMSQAVKAQRAGNTNEAVLDYQLALSADPTYFDAQYNLALLAFQTGELKRSLAGWEAALALQPDSINARYNFALALKQGNYAHDAAYELQRILEAKPNETRAHLALGNLYAQQLDEPHKARSHYLKVVELEPRNPQAPAIRYWLAANP